MIRYRTELLAAMIFAVVIVALSRGVSAQAPQATPLSLAKAAVDATAQSPDQEVLRAVAEVRDDVRALRHEVDNLRTLIETAQGKSRANALPEKIAERIALAGAAAKEPLLKDGVYFFHAAWSGPCQKMRPIVDRLKREGLPLVDVDVDEHRDLRDKFHIDTIPASVLVIGGKEQRRSTGMLTEEQLRRIVAMIPPSPSTSATSLATRNVASNSKTDSKPVSSIGAVIPPASAAHHDSPRNARGTAAKPTEYLLRSYSVADLVVPLPGKSPNGNFNENFEKLMGLMTGTIEPTAWQKAGGKGQVVQSDKTLSLIIRQTPAVHRQVRALLRGLRALHNWQVCLELSLVQNGPGNLLNGIGSTARLPDNANVLALNDEQKTALVAAARNTFNTNVFVAEVTMFPGTYASVGPAPNGSGATTIDIETIDSTDRYAVNLRLGLHDNKTGTKTVEPITVNVPNLQPVVIELKRTPKHPATLLVVRPQFLFPIEEEEELEASQRSPIEPFEIVPMTR
jgi:thiol-disulfide isomerase/thioredoxin